MPIFLPADASCPLLYYPYPQNCFMRQDTRTIMWWMWQMWLKVKIPTEGIKITSVLFQNSNPATE